MNNRLWSLFLLSSLILIISCGPDTTQSDWHINTLNLADEYYPKYFAAIEESLQKNDIQYEKEYSEQVDDKFKCKYYDSTYYISETIYFKAKLEFEYRHSYMSDIDFKFYYKYGNEEEVLNISQNYLNVMIDVTNFCSYCFFGKGEGFNSLYNELKDKYHNAGYSVDNPPSSDVYVSEKTWEETPPLRSFTLTYDGTFSLLILLIDHLTDINIWDK